MRGATRRLAGKDPKFSNATLQSPRFRNVAFLNLGGQLPANTLGPRGAAPP